MAKTKQENDVYLNPKQQKIFYCGARDVRLSGARRFGKTDGSIGPHVVHVSTSMPGMTGGWLGVSKAQLYSKTVPATFAAIARMFGMVEGIDYGWGRPPKDVPRSIMVPRNYDNIIWFANGTIWALISLAQTGSANSYTLSHVIGDECKFMSKSKIDGEVMPALSGQVHPLALPAFSEHNPYYRGSFFASDASLTARGNWLENEEVKLDQTLDHGPFEGKTYRSIQEELEQYASRCMYFNELLRNAKLTGHQIIVVDKLEKKLVHALAEKVMNHEGEYRVIPNYGHRINKATVDMCVNYCHMDADTAEKLYNYEYLITKEEHFEMMMLRGSKKFAEHINDLRCNAFCFFRATTLDNVDIVTEDYIRRMKRDLPAFIFAVSVLNLKLTKSNDGFYSNLDIENVHGYIPDDCPAIDASFTRKTASTVKGRQQINVEYESPDFDHLQKIHDCTLDGDVVDNLPLYISMDYNANINWVVTGQVYKRDGGEALNVLSSMYVKNERKLHELMADWNHYYAPHRQKNRDVYYFYDATAKFRGYAVEGMQDFKDTIIADLLKYGWNVIGVDMGKPVDHEYKYKVINEALAGISFPAIRLNRENNQELIVALENAGVSIGYKGFRKDKSGEKLSEDADDAVRLEYRTDGTDAFDSLYLGVKFHRRIFGGMCMPSGH